MFKFDNTHIFTGYLKQLLSSFNLPTCKVYTKEFADYLARHGKEDPRVIESSDVIEYTNEENKTVKRIGTRVNYLKDNELWYHLWPYSKDTQSLNRDKAVWKRLPSAFYDKDIPVHGLTRVLNSPGSAYDTTTHEYLGDYLRFLRDYYSVNLMSLYNCFNNKIYGNIYYKHKIKLANPAFDSTQKESQENPKYLYSTSTFNSQDSNYRIYAFPVKLFQKYTIAIDCSQGIELFCGLYRTHLDGSAKNLDLIDRTYKKINKTIFKQPFLYDRLDVEFWNFDREISIDSAYPRLLESNTITRFDIANREQDLKLFIKVPTSCKSSIVVLEGDFRGFNDFKYSTDSSDGGTWKYKQNHAVINFGNKSDEKIDVNKSPFKPISKLQLLAFNTGESHPFADRLVEYLSNSAITPLDEIPDNIKRAQAVMEQNQHYFKINGLWEDKMQKIIYDYVMNSGPITVQEGKLVNSHSGNNPKYYGYHKRLGHTTKSTLYDVLGYVDKDAEKWYASWKNENGDAKVLDSIQNIDIYNGLFDM